jgi:hypothetical protein
MSARMEFVDTLGPVRRNVVGDDVDVPAGWPVGDEVDAAADDLPAVERLVANYGYPLIAKPRTGNGSRSVRIVFDDSQRTAIARLPGYLLQAYLELMDLRDLARDGVPLFHAPRLQQIACQAVIGPDGHVRGLAGTRVPDRMPGALSPQSRRRARTTVRIALPCC